MIAVGVARPRAQGQAIIRTAIKFIKALVKEGSGPKKYHRKKVTIAIPITVGTNTEATLSASL
jgi:hypothetical protein